MNLLITGFSGFVARHFIEYLCKNKYQYNILGIDIKSPTYCFDEIDYGGTICFEECNMLDEKHLMDIISSFSPDYVLHLASFSSVAYSWKNPADSFRNNTNIFLNLVNAITSLQKKCRILSVGSSEEYGNVTEEDIPLKEDDGFMPVSPYAVARVSQEMLSKVYADNFGVDIIMTRSFNHIGPYQDDRFVVPSFIKRISEIKRSGKTEGTIETGDISIIRDFVDVRDVVEAYYLLLLNGKSGEVYNVCSGNGVMLGNVIAIISELLGICINTVVNQNYVRPQDNRIIIGSNEKINKELGWKPCIELSDTIRDMIYDFDVPIS